MKRMLLPDCCIQSFCMLKKRRLFEKVARRTPFKRSKLKEEKKQKII